MRLCSVPDIGMVLILIFYFKMDGESLPINVAWVGFQYGRPYAGGTLWSGVGFIQSVT